MTPMQRREIETEIEVGVEAWRVPPDSKRKYASDFD